MTTPGIVVAKCCPSCGAKTLPEDIHVKTVNPMTFYYGCETCGESYDLGEVRGIEAEAVDVTIQLHPEE